MEVAPRRSLRVRNVSGSPSNGGRAHVGKPASPHPSSIKRNATSATCKVSPSAVFKTWLLARENILWPYPTHEELVALVEAAGARSASVALKNYLGNSRQRVVKRLLISHAAGRTVESIRSSTRLAAFKAFAAAANSCAAAIKGSACPAPCLQQRLSAHPSLAVRIIARIASGSGRALSTSRPKGARGLSMAEIAIAAAAAVDDSGGILELGEKGMAVAHAALAAAATAPVTKTKQEGRGIESKGAEEEDTEGEDWEEDGDRTLPAFVRGLVPMQFRLRTSATVEKQQRWKRNGRKRQRLLSRVEAASKAERPNGRMKMRKMVYDEEEKEAGLLLCALSQATVTSVATTPPRLPPLPLALPPWTSAPAAAFSSSTSTLIPHGWEVFASRRGGGVDDALAAQKELHDKIRNAQRS